MCSSLSTEPPSFQSKVENVTVLSGWSSGLLCQAQHGPAPVITWYKSKDGIQLQMLQNSTSVIYDYQTFYLSLEEVKCVARNSFGSDIKTLLVKKQGISKLRLFSLGYNVVIAFCTNTGRYWLKPSSHSSP